MSYDIHITRGNFWAGENGPEIPLNEWLNVTSSDGALHSMPIINDAKGNRFDLPPPPKPGLIARLFGRN